HDALRLDAEVPGHAEHVAFSNHGGRLAAAVGTRGANDLVLDVLGDAPQNAIGRVMRVHVPAGTQVVVAVRVDEPSDLGQIRDHRRLATTSVMSSGWGAPAANSPRAVVTASTMAAAGFVRFCLSTSMKRSSPNSS